MILNLADNDFLRLTRARGTTVEVLDGRVWITEAGRERDAFVSTGMRYNVAGDGLVVVGREEGHEGGTAARIAVRPPVWRLRRPGPRGPHDGKVDPGSASPAQTLPVSRHTSGKASLHAPA